MNPAMVLAQCALGMLPWTSFIPYVVAEFLGALVGALICFVMYKDHFTESEGNVNPIAIRNIFSTNPNCRNLPRNFFVETIATTIFLSAILAVATKYETQLPIGVGLIVWAVGMGLGGTTGFAMNQARDLGPRLAFQLLPIKNKANNDWQYGLLVPGIAPFVGALLVCFVLPFVFRYLILKKTDIQNQNEYLSSFIFFFVILNHIGQYLNRRFQRLYN